MSGLPHEGGKPPHQSFYENLCAPCTRILGMDLRPYSLGAEILLHATGNNFVTGGKPGIDDLISGIVICSQEYSDALHDMQRPEETAAAVNKWHKRIFSQAKKSKVEIDFHQAIEAFAAYLKDAVEPPTFIISEDGKEIEAPSPILFINILTSKLGWTLSDALNHSKHAVVWHVFVYQAMEGKITLVDGELMKDVQRQADAWDLELRNGRVNGLR